MGMFDTVIPEYELPDSPPKQCLSGRDLWWQTKDFDCPMMDNYRISAAGRLEREVGHSEPCEAPADTPESLKPFRTQRWVQDGWEDMNHHGTLNFYAYAGYGDSAKGYDPSLWYEYDATFTDGQLTSIKREHSKP